MCKVLQGRCTTVDEAFQLYAERRTYNGKGITNASQERWASWPPACWSAVGP